MKPTDTTTTAQKTVRPTKRQRELLIYIEAFIAEHGYSPSYREIMKGLDYNSVSTVAIHVNNLIRRGHLQKRDRSARSLEVVHSLQLPKKIVPRQPTENEERWLIDKVELYFKDAESRPFIEPADLEQLQVLLGAMQVLGLEGAATAFLPRLHQLQNRIKTAERYVT